jgi:hypothetical protein
MSTTPALSVQVPWANQILRPGKTPGLGFKWCENRSWSTDYRGPLLIHVSGPGGAIIGEVQLLEVIESRRERGESAAKAIVRLQKLVRRVYRAAGLRYPRDWTCADVGCGYWWLLANPIRFPKAVDCSGKLRLWVPSESVRRRIRNARSITAHAKWIIQPPIRLVVASDDESSLNERRSPA